MKNKILIPFLITTLVVSTAWFVVPPADTYAQVAPRKIRLFAGFKLTIVKTKLKLAQIDVAPAGGGGSAPTVTTNTTLNASGYDGGSMYYWANLGGNITSTGGSNATVRGFAWGAGCPGLTALCTATTTENGDWGTGVFFTNCADGVGDGAQITLYYRAYATNPNGTGYGSIEDELLTATPISECGVGG